MRILKKITLVLISLPMLILTIVNGREFFNLYMKRASDLLDEFMITKKI